MQWTVPGSVHAGQSLYNGATSCTENPILKREKPQAYHPDTNSYLYLSECGLKKPLQVIMSPCHVPFVFPSQLNCLKVEKEDVSVGPKEGRCHTGPWIFLPILLLSRLCLLFFILMVSRGVWNQTLYT